MRLLGIIACLAIGSSSAQALRLDRAAPVPRVLTACAALPAVTGVDGNLPAWNALPVQPALSEPQGMPGLRVAEIVKVALPGLPGFCAEPPVDGAVLGMTGLAMSESVTGVVPVIAGLSCAEPSGGTVAALPALPRQLPAGANVVGLGAVAAAEPVAAPAIGMAGFGASSPVVDAGHGLGGLPAAQAAEFDLLQTDLKLWNEAAAGRLNYAARKAKARGDLAEYERLYGAYCAELEKGMDRRAALQKKHVGRRR